MVSQVPSGAAAAATACGKKRALVYMMCINACSAFFILTVSVSTDFWIYTFERETSTNGTTNINSMHSGLWRKCSERKTLPAGKKTHFVWTQEAIEISGSRDNCSYHNSSHVVAAIAFIGRKSNEIKPTDIHDMQVASLFPMGGLLFLLIGCVITFFSFCDPKTTIMIFISGALFVFSGLCLLIGIVLYVGNVSQAFDSSSASISGDQKYVYKYGSSFYLCVVGFVFTEFAGVFAVYLYIARSKHYVNKKIRLSDRRMVADESGITVQISDSADQLGTLQHHQHHHRQAPLLPPPPPPPQMMSQTSSRVVSQPPYQQQQQQQSSGWTPRSYSEDTATDDEMPRNLSSYGLSRHQQQLPPPPPPPPPPLGASIAGSNPGESCSCPQSVHELHLMNSDTPGGGHHQQQQQQQPQHQHGHNQQNEHQVQQVHPRYVPGPVVSSIGTGGYPTPPRHHNSTLPHQQHQQQQQQQQQQYRVGSAGYYTGGGGHKAKTTPV